MVPQQLFVLRHNPHLLFELLASLTPTDFSIGCNICSAEFYMKYLLDSHILKHNVKCEICDLCFNSTAQLLIHREEIHKKKLHKCYECINSHMNFGIIRWNADPL